MAANSKTDPAEHREILVFDLNLKAPACVLIQAAFGCGSNPSALRHFDSRHWITTLTPGMKKVAGTDEQWQRAAAMTRAAWGDKRPHE